MSGKIMGYVMRAKLPATAKAVLMVYAYHANDQNQEAWPSEETVAEMACLGLRAVQEWKAWLKEKGLLLPAGTDGHKTKRLRVNLAQLEAIAIQKPAPDAVYNEEPTPQPEGKPAPGAEKPAPSAGEPEKPAPGAQKPAPGAGKTGLNIPLNQTGLNNNNKTPAAADEPRPKARPKKPTNAAEAARTWTEVTGMVAIPGDLAEQEGVIAKILDLADKHGDATAEYLKPFWQALTLAKNKNQRAYSRTSTFWVTTWAVGNEIPDLVTSQLAGKKDIPAELAAYLTDHGPAGPAMRRAGGQGLTPDQLEAEYQRHKNGAAK